MRAVVPWVEEPLAAFVREAAVRVVLLMTGAGQVVAQHGFTRSLDVMSAAALGAGIVASTRELAREIGSSGFGAIVHQGREVGVVLAPFEMPDAQWITLAVFGSETSLGIVQLFLGQLADQLRRAAPREPAPRELLAESFEEELNASLRALFGR